MEDGTPRLRALPSVGEVLAGPALRDRAGRVGGPGAEVAARRGIAAARERILAGDSASGDLVPDRDVLERARRETAPRLVRVLNATGVVLHTNLGRAPLHEEALARVVEVASGYSNLEIDLRTGRRGHRSRSEEHTSELQSHVNLVCRLLLEKKKKTENTQMTRRQKTKYTKRVS